MKTYTIHLYHAGLHQSDRDTLNTIATPVTAIVVRTWTYTGSLDEFAAKWGKLFLVHPVQDIIMVTHHNSFGAR